MKKKQEFTKTSSEANKQAKLVPKKMSLIFILWKYISFKFP